jgi:cytochrome P450
MIAELLGVPSSDHETFRRWSDALIEAGGGGPSQETFATIAEMAAYIGERAAERRRTPRQDVLSQLANAEIDGDRLTDPEIVIFALTLLVAGNETTRNLISGGMKALIEYPEQQATLRRRPDLMTNAVEEMLRFVHPIQNFTRRVLQDTELRNRKLREGEYVVLLYGSANRDEEVFGSDAERFDIERSEARRHLSFGFGEHLCLGASLARLETRILFEELFKRFSGVAFAGPVEKLSSVLINGVRRMPVVFES